MPHVTQLILTSNISGVPTPLKTAIYITVMAIADGNIVAICVMIIKNTR